MSMFAFPSISKYCIVGVMPSSLGVGALLWLSNSVLSAGEGGGEERSTDEVGMEGERVERCGTSWSKHPVHCIGLASASHFTW